MENMFNRCKSFNQDISKWNVSKVEDSESMFEDCPIEEKYKPKFK
jgi:surface protein